MTQQILIDTALRAVKCRYCPGCQNTGNISVSKTNILPEPSQRRLQQKSLISVISGNPHPSWRACGAASWRAWEASSSPGEQLGNQMSWKDWQSTLQAASCQENCPGGREVGLANLFPCVLSTVTKYNFYL